MDMYVVLIGLYQSDVGWYYVHLDKTNKFETGFTFVVYGKYQHQIHYPRILIACV